MPDFSRFCDRKGVLRDFRELLMDVSKLLIISKLFAVCDTMYSSWLSNMGLIALRNSPYYALIWAVSSHEIAFIEV